MSFDAGSITGSLGLDISEYTHGMLEANAIAHLFPNIVQSFLAEPLLGFMEITKEATHALFEMVHGVTSSESHLHDLAKQIGVSVEFLDGMGKAFERNGGSAAEMAETLTHLSRAAYEAATQGGRAAGAFETMGVNVKDSEGHLRPLEELVMAVADGMKGLDAGVERNAIAMETLGRSGGHTAAFFAEGKEEISGYIERLKAMGAITTAESAKSAKAFDDLLVEAGHAWEGIRMVIAEPIRDALKPWLDELLAWVHTHPAEIKHIAGDVAGFLIEILTLTGKAAGFLLEHAQLLEAALGAAGMGAAALLAAKTITALGEAYTILTTKILAAEAAQISMNFALKSGLALAAGGLIGGSLFGGLGGNLGGGLGGLLGGILGQILIPIPGVGFAIGTAAGGLAGGFAGSEIQKHFSVGEINVNAEISGDSPGETARKTAQQIQGELQKLLQNAEGQRNADRATAGL